MEEILKSLRPGESLTIHRGRRYWTLTAMIEREGKQTYGLNRMLMVEGQVEDSFSRLTRTCKTMLEAIRKHISEENDSAVNP